MFDSFHLASSFITYIMKGMWFREKRSWLKKAAYVSGSGMEFAMCLAQYNPTAVGHKTAKYDTNRTSFAGIIAFLGLKVCYIHSKTK